ncbi:MAG: tRNA (adenosine(37)-N6)-threonylcarbamoyltransferase complex transferase subunit TsaD [Oscillospiraceae bacterium]|nr:tRNA (adenosine(37)-N6)-threonylcarbamoyltransferase complex transferase subunit TsaD [Oscillospiraceae bacterium]
MIILGIESSCDETAAAVVKDERQVLSNVIVSQVDEHTLYGGIVPEIASRRHVEAISQTVTMALSMAEVSLEEIDAIAVTYTPGLIGSLLVGVNFAKSLAYTIGKPLLAVNHLKGHISSLYLTYPDLLPPFVCLIASGAHTHIVEVNGYDEFKVLGRSVDDAAGEAFDKVARALGLAYPGGPQIAAAAEHGNTTGYILPMPKTENEYDVSFSGLKTTVINIINIAKMTGEAISKEDMAASFQAVAVEMLTKRLISAAVEKGLDVALCGGVAANTMLRTEVKKAAEQAGVKAYFADKSLCGDNAAMIAAAGFYEIQLNNLANISLNGYASSELA